MLPARPNATIQRWFDWYCRRALRAHFHRVHLFHEAPPDAFDPAVSRIYVANHCSFWDGIVLYHLLRRRRPQAAYCMIDEAQVREHPFFRRVGGFSVRRGDGRDALRAIDYAAGLLGASPCAVVVFPQGEIRPADERPMRFERGVARLIRAAPQARVLPVALRYEFWLEQRAEAMVLLGQEMSLGRASAETILSMLEMWLRGGVRTLADHGAQHRPGDEVLLHGRRSISRWKDLFRLEDDPPAPPGP